MLVGRNPKKTKVGLKQYSDEDLANFGNLIRMEAIHAECVDRQFDSDEDAERLDLFYRAANIAGNYVVDMWDDGVIDEAGAEGAADLLMLGPIDVPKKHHKFVRDTIRTGILATTEEFACFSRRKPRTRKRRKS